MADEFQVGSGNWWDSSTSSRTRFDRGSTAAASTSVNSSINMGSFGWPTEIVAARSSMDSSVSMSGGSMLFPPAVDHSSQKLQAHESSSAGGSGEGSMLPDPNLQIMGLALSSQAMDWNQAALFRGEKAQSSFRSMLQEDASTNFQQESGVTSSQDHQWRHKLYAGSPDDSSVITEFKPMNQRGLSLDQPQFSSNMSSSNSTITCQGLSPNFQVESASYAASPNSILQGLLVPDHHHQQQQQSMNYSYPTSYGMESTSNQLMPSNSWSKFPQFLRNSPPKQQPPHGQLHFSNNTPFWNASSTGMSDVRSSLFPPLQTQLPMPNFEEKSKNASEVRDLPVAKKSSSSSSAPSNKRPRNETPAPMPAFKVRKEKMGDRITALQQLVSPFGKTDTASVLSEAIEYIKFLHDQVNVLSTPYMKSGAPMQHQQNPDKSKDPEGPKQDLRSRGLCLVPVSSTFPVTHETAVDYWTPTFGGTFR